MNSLRRGGGETLLSVLGLLLLIGTLIAFDPRVRERIDMALVGGADTNPTGVMRTAHAVGSALVYSARQQSMEHAPLLVFATAATVLVVFMLRT